MKILLADAEKLQLCKLIAIICIQQPDKVSTDYWHDLARRLGPKYQEVTLRRYQAEDLLAVVAKAVEKISLRLNAQDEVGKIRATALDTIFQSIYNKLKVKLDQGDDENGTNEGSTVTGPVDATQEGLEGTGCPIDLSGRGERAGDDCGAATGSDGGPGQGG